MPPDVRAKLEAKRSGMAGSTRVARRVRPAELEATERAGRDLAAAEVAALIQHNN